jgi:xylulokinase
MNRWIKDITGNTLQYAEINKMAESIALGSEGLLILPFGNGAERMLENRMPGAQIGRLQFTVHREAHLFRAVQEGIACAFRYGFDILKENGVTPTVIRAGKANMFLSRLFTELFVNLTNVPVELYKNDGSVGAAIGAGIGAGIYSSREEAFKSYKPESLTEPEKNNGQHEELYGKWKDFLEKNI